MTSPGRGYDNAGMPTQRPEWRGGSGRPFLHGSVFHGLGSVRDRWSSGAAEESKVRSGSRSSQRMVNPYAKRHWANGPSSHHPRSCALVRGVPELGRNGRRLRTGKMNRDQLWRSRASPCDRIGPILGIALGKRGVPTAKHAHTRRYNTSVSATRFNHLGRDHIGRDAIKRVRFPLALPIPL